MHVLKYPAPTRAAVGLHRLAPAVGILLMFLSACSDNPMAPSVYDGEPPATSGSGEPGAGASSDPGAPSPDPSIANPLQGARLFVQPGSNAARQVDEWRQSRPADAAQMEKIAGQPQAIWFGDWNPEPYAWVNEVTGRVRAAGALPVYILYNIPQRDCGLYSSGGAGSAAAYQRWISEVARGIGSNPAVVILEPDALAGMDCLSGGDRDARVQMIAQAVRTLKASSSVSVYLDAGNARWHAPAAIAERLRAAGIAEADGFALNISNFLTDDETVGYGNAVSDLVGGKHFVIDTSRNGAGPAPDLDWCNPEGRALGRKPTTSTGHARVDAFLWLKAPGESDGECNGGPHAGKWWAEYALGLARRAAW